MKTKTKGRPHPSLPPGKTLRPRGGGVRFFRFLKRELGKRSQGKSMDLLDQWILKKRPLSLFF